MIWLFWDKLNDEFEFLGDDGNFYGYGEDTVAIDQGAPEEQCRYWMKMCKIREVHPLNESKRYDIFDPRKDDWIQFDNCDEETFREVCLQAGVSEDAIY